MAHDQYEERKRLTFEQAEGLAPLPSQLNRTEITPVLRARFWILFNDIIERFSHFTLSAYYMTSPWDDIVRDEYVYRHGGFIDGETHRKVVAQERFKRIIQFGTYDELYGLIQFVLHHPKCPKFFAPSVQSILDEQRSAYRVIGGDTLVPIASDEVANAINAALDASNKTKLRGSHTHLRQASIELSNGSFANSVRESISAVESIARVLEPTADLSKALGRLERSGHLHKAMKHGFGSLYGWTSDEDGIRHALLEDGDAKVDETDALFMIGACASFVSYLIAKKRAAGIAD